MDNDFLGWISHKTIVDKLADDYDDDYDLEEQCESFKKELAANNLTSDEIEYVKNKGNK